MNSSVLHFHSTASAVLCQQQVQMQEELQCTQDKRETELSLKLREIVQVHYKTEIKCSRRRTERKSICKRQPYAFRDNNSHFLILWNNFLAPHSTSENIFFPFCWNQTLYKGCWDSFAFKIPMVWNNEGYCLLRMWYCLSCSCTHSAHKVRLKQESPYLVLTIYLHSGKFK